MVNKQYNVQSLTKNKTKNSSNHSDAQTIKQNITVIPPNETHVNASTGAPDSYQSQNAFERNISHQFYHGLNDTFDFIDGNFDKMTPNDSMADHIKNSSAAGATDGDSQSQKHLSINDIGRFQYILQMDREMVRQIFMQNYKKIEISHSSPLCFSFNKKSELIFTLPYNLPLINIMNNFTERSFMSLSDRYCCSYFEQFVSVAVSFFFRLSHLKWSMVVLCTAHGTQMWCIQNWSVCSFANLNRLQSKIESIE